MIKIHKDQCPDYEQEMRQCGMAPVTKADIVALAKKAKVPLKVLEDAINTTETGSGKRRKSRHSPSGKGRSAITQSIAVVIVTLLAAGVTVIAKGSIYYQLLVTGILKQYCSLDFFKRAANDLIAAELGGRLTCQQIEEHNLRMIYAIWAGCTGLGLSTAYINNNFWKAVEKVENVIVSMTEKKQKKSPTSPARKRSSSSSDVFMTAPSSHDSGAETASSDLSTSTPSPKMKGRAPKSAKAAKAAKASKSAKAAKARKTRKSISPERSVSPKFRDPVEAFSDILGVHQLKGSQYKEMDFRKMGEELKKVGAKATQTAKDAYAAASELRRKAKARSKAKKTKKKVKSQAAKRSRKKSATPTSSSSSISSSYVESSDDRLSGSSTSS